MTPHTQIPEDVEKLRTTQVEHKLRVDRKIGVESERHLVVLSVLGELLTQLNELAIEPPQDIKRLFRLGLAHRPPRHETRARFLVEG